MWDISKILDKGGEGLGEGCGVRGEVLGVRYACGSPSDFDCDSVSCSMVKWRASTALGHRSTHLIKWPRLRSAARPRWPSEAEE